MTAAAISGLAHYGEEAPRPPEMKCFRAKCPRTGTRTVTLYFYLRAGTVPATMTPMGVTLCAPCAAEAEVGDFVGDEGWDQLTAIFDQFEKPRPKRELTVIRTEELR